MAIFLSNDYRFVIARGCLRLFLPSPLLFTASHGMFLLRSVKSRSFSSPNFHEKFLKAFLFFSDFHFSGCQPDICLTDPFAIPHRYNKERGATEIAKGLETHCDYYSQILSSQLLSWRARVDFQRPT